MLVKHFCFMSRSTVIFEKRKGVNDVKRKKE